MSEQEWLRMPRVENRIFGSCTCSFVSWLQWLVVGVVALVGLALFLRRSRWSWGCLCWVCWAVVLHAVVQRVVLLGVAHCGCTVGGHLLAVPVVVVPRPGSLGFILGMGLCPFLAWVAVWPRRRLVFVV